jgi:hypothetical protein
MPELPNIVRERLKLSRPTADHPDADALTAFAERSLPESERAVVAEHLARCHDCRDVLALALPATVTVETARVPLPVRGGWLRAPVLRWGVVAAGFAVLTVTGLLQYQRRHVGQPFIAAREASAPVPEATTLQASRTEESTKPVLGTPGARAGSANVVAANASRVSADSARGSADANSTNQRVAAAAPRNDAVAPSTLTLHGRKLTPALPFHGPAAGGIEARSQLVAGNTGDQAANQPFQYQGKKKDEGQVAGVGGRAFMDVTVDKAKAPATATVEVSAASPLLETAATVPASSSTLRASWGISASGGLLRSFDQGRTWASVDMNASFPMTAQMVMVVPESQKYQQATRDASLQAQSQAPSQSESKALSKSKAVSPERAAASAGSIPFFRAISAAGVEIWAGGSAGVLYHSADGGERWTRVVPSAAGISLTGDIIGIAFSDPQHGQITTSAQELWTTSDAGLTWQKQ